MSGKLIIMAGLAVAFGATSYVGGNYYLESQTQALTEARINELDANRPVVEAVELAKVVVATSEIKFGEAISASNIKVVDWPKDAFPEGAFTATSDVISDGNRRVLTTIFPGEPIITAKITGENGRAGLSGVITEGMRAVTVPVNTVNGVAGFVQPGDRVDILLTKNNSENNGTSSTTIMEYVKILSVDQNAGSRNETAQLASSVTIETDTRGTEKIAWALNVGTLSLTLRAAGDAKVSKTNDNKQDSLFSFQEEKPTRTSIKVVSGNNVKEYNVAIEGAQKPENQNNNNN